MLSLYNKEKFSLDYKSEMKILGIILQILIQHLLFCFATCFEQVILHCIYINNALLTHSYDLSSPAYTHNKRNKKLAFESFFSNFKS